jgi:hypothetical protein
MCDLFGTKPVADRTVDTVVTCPHALTAYNLIYCWDTVIWRGLVFVWILNFQRCHLFHISPCDWNLVVVAPVPTTVLPQQFPFSSHLLHIWAETLFSLYVPKISAARNARNERCMQPPHCWQKRCYSCGTAGYTRHLSPVTARAFSLG